MSQVSQVGWRWVGGPVFDPGQRRGGDFPCLLLIQTDSGAHSASCKMNTGAFKGLMKVEHGTSHTTSSYTPIQCMIIVLKDTTS